MNCIECGYNLDGIPSTPYCPECGAGRNAAAILEARQKRDSLAEFALWGSVALGVVATFSAFHSPLAPWLILFSGVAANLVLAVLIERTGRIAREHSSAIFRFVRSAGVCLFRIAAMWFVCGMTGALFQIAWEFFHSY
ncbi:MAG: hypothetical protein KF805_13675 [Phycisphaeraceae bacterium]|nr:hypothetical protein [Phycisphaeraceae bacterium]